MNNPTIEPVVKKYDELRYQLMPYTYTATREARDAGLPLMRAMWLHYPTDTIAVRIGDQYLWGRDLLIAPVHEKGATKRDVYLPAGEWYDWWTNTRSSGGRMVTRDVDLATMPIYVRAGAIIPVDPVRQYTSEPAAQPTTLRVYRGANGSYSLYDDDGISQDYLRGRGSSFTRLAWNDRTKQLTFEGGAPARSFNVQMLPENVTKSVKYAGQRMTVTF
jgi:alpha-glucosidase/alpha-D-xyloside xylohydrolase